jgi:hypothetical protein
MASILTGCGGSPSSDVQTVHGDGFHFEAPAGWSLVRKTGSATASDGKVNLLQAQRFTLEKAYRPAIFAKAARELDGVAAKIAVQAHGRLETRATRQIDGRKTRYYRIVYGQGKTEEIAFVLVDRNEYQLLCRRASSSPDTNCAQLFDSFAVT